MMYTYILLGEMETGEKKESTVPEEKSDGPSPDLMSQIEALKIEIKMLTSELLMRTIKQMASKPHNVS